MERAVKVNQFRWRGIRVTASIIAVAPATSANKRSLTKELGNGPSRKNAAPISLTLEDAKPSVPGQKPGTRWTDPFLLAGD